MDYLFLITRTLSYITTFGLPISAVAILAGIIVDIKQKKFRWSGLALLFLVAIFSLLLVQIKLTYQLTSSFE